MLCNLIIWLYNFFKLTDFIKAFMNVFQRIACDDFFFQCLYFQLLWCYKCIIPIIWQAKAL